MGTMIRATNSGAVATLALAMFMAFGLAGLDIRSDLALSAGAAPAGQPAGPADAAVTGAIDIHAHQDPDSVGPSSPQQARSVDAVDLARLAKARGMRGLVLKHHYDQTAGLAYLVRKAVPGLEVFGGVDLNRPMGGINAAAVVHMAEVKGGWGRIVWMPTFDAEHYVRRSNQPSRPFVSVARNGELLPEVKEIISVIARTRTRDSHGPLVLATGHSSPEEALMLVREARRQGVEHIVLTHPMVEIVGMSIAQMQEAARLGAFVEFVSSFARGPEADTRTRDYAEAIRKVGVRSSIVSSDLGQMGNPLHPDGLAAAAQALRRQGFTEQELDQLFKENPARLLGLR